MYVVEETGERLVSWRDKVADAALQARLAGGIDTFTGPVRLAITFYMPRPKTVKRAFPCVAPDLDKLTRAVGDALQQAAVYKNDAQIVACCSSKFYSYDDPNKAPGAWIVVSEIDDDIELPGGRP